MAPLAFGSFADRKIQLVTALKLPNHTAMRLPMVPRISPVCFPSEIERIAHNWYQPEYEIDSNVGDHLQKNERRNPQSRGMITMIGETELVIASPMPAYQSDERIEPKQIFVPRTLNCSSIVRAIHRICLRRCFSRFALCAAKAMGKCEVSNIRSENKAI